jgi:hypothetical protein
MKRGQKKKRKTGIFSDFLMTRKEVKSFLIEQGGLKYT